MALPIFQTDDRDLSLLQTNWSSPLNLLLANPLVSGILIKNVALTSGANIINHKLGRNIQGWIVTGMHGAFIQVFDTQSTNTTPNLTLKLTASAAGSIDLYVF